MPTLRQSLVATVLRRYPLYSGCGTLANHRVLQRIAGPGTDVAWVKVSGGLYVLAPLDDYVGRAVFFAGELDRKVTWVCRRLVRPGDTVLDIGANLGLVTVILSGLVGPRGRVHAFEPIPAMQELIERAAARNGSGNINLHRVALGATSAELLLSVPHGHAGSASFVETRHLADSTEIMVPVRTLSDVMAGEEVDHVRLIKIDVEGFEAEVLAGAAQFFASSRPDAVLFELNDHQAKPGLHPTMRMLAEYGYGFFRIPRRYTCMRLDPVGALADISLGACHDFLAVRLGAAYDEVGKLLGVA